MIRHLVVKGLHGRPNLNLDLAFHPDLNIVTGKNGSGKTTILKLVWFLLSGNAERIGKEINFDSATLTTDTFTLTVETTGRRKRRIQKWVFEPTNGPKETIVADPPEHVGRGSPAQSKVNSLVLAVSGRSLFFPTFRRIEGGFSTGGDRVTDDARFYYEAPYMLGNAISKLASELSVRQHRFVASLSTHDLVTMLTQQYANISEQINEDHRALSREIRALVSQHPRSGTAETKLDLATDTLARIGEQVTVHSNKQDALLRPFTALSDLISTILQHKGIRITSRLTLGEASQAIASDALSAGEKQMLSFLTYNAFENDSVVFIDEPEISLHVDWQRLLFPTLFQQGVNNQFIVATHSPFIYSKYLDKELALDRDRGDSLGDA